MATRMCYMDRLPDELLSMIFMDIITQFDTQNNQPDMPRPISEDIVLAWKDMPDWWISKWKHQMFIYHSNKVVDEGYNALCSYLLTITSVSRKWRAVGLGTPRLWRYVTHAGNIEPLYEPVHYYPFQVCIDRSGGIPLEISSKRLSLLKEVVEYLAAKGGLGRVATLNVDEFLEEGEFLNYVANISCPNVHGFTLRTTSLYALKDYLPPLRNFTLLRYLELQCFALQDSDVTVPVIELQSLKTLEIDFFWRASVMALCDVLQAPKLERLLLAQYNSEESDTDALFEHGHPILNSLKELSCGGAISAGDVRGLLQHAAKVEIVRLFEPQAPDTFDTLLRSLASDLDGEKTVACKLQHLSYAQTSTDDSAAPLDPLHGLIESRRSPKTASIQSIGLSARTLSLCEQSSLQSLALKVDVVEWGPPHWHENLSW